MKCDHTNCKTRFCPDCGEAVMDHSLFTLRSYLVRSLHSCQSAREDLKRKYAGRETLDRHLEANTKKMEKWVKWIECLDSIIGNGGGE